MQESGDGVDLGMDFDLLDSDCDKKPGQKRPRRRVVVDTKDANGRPFTAAEIRRMKRCVPSTACPLLAVHSCKGHRGKEHCVHYLPACLTLYFNGAGTCVMLACHKHFNQ